MPSFTVVQNAEGNREVQSSAVRLHPAGLLQLPDDADCAAIAFSHKHCTLVYAAGTGAARGFCRPHRPSDHRILVLVCSHTHVG
jgi:hypothetical protein